MPYLCIPFYIDKSVHTVHARIWLELTIISVCYLRLLRLRDEFFDLLVLRGRMRTGGTEHKYNMIDINWLLCDIYQGKDAWFHQRVFPPSLCYRTQTNTFVWSINGISYNFYCSTISGRYLLPLSLLLSVQFCFWCLTWWMSLLGSHLLVSLDSHSHQSHLNSKELFNELGNHSLWMTATSSSGSLDLPVSLAVYSKSIQLSVCLWPLACHRVLFLLFFL